MKPFFIEFEKEGIKISRFIYLRYKKCSYPKGIKIPDEMMEQINIIRSDFYGEWNYTITQEAYQIVHVNFLQTLM
ncbi:hypothetical protein DRN76_05625 [Methanosarcinales archaeon]|nr:MAG: hypothetical protein DRN76_05625 [Methanosarcinales archaeon]